MSVEIEILKTLSDGSPDLFSVAGAKYEVQSEWCPMDHTKEDEQPYWWTSRAYCVDDDQEYDIAVESDSWEKLLNPQNPEIVPVDS